MRPRPLHLLLWSLIALVLGLALLLGLTLRTWDRLTDEALIAELTFDPAGPGRWRVTLATGDRCRPRSFILEGEQWRLDARFLKWKPWANLLGLDARYRLERLESRHPEVAEGGTTTVSAFDLGPRKAPDLLHLARSLDHFGFLLDALYGSSAYQEIDPSLRYRVYRSQWGLLVRTTPRGVGELRDGHAVIRIDKACGRPGPAWGRLPAWLRDLTGADGATRPSSMDYNREEGGKRPSRSARRA